MPAQEARRSRRSERRCEPPRRPAPPAGAPRNSSWRARPSLQIGRRQGNLIEIVDGLKGGETVVTSGQNKLANNSPVTINNEIDPAAIALGDGKGPS